MAWSCDITQARALPTELALALALSSEQVLRVMKLDSVVMLFNTFVELTWLIIATMSGSSAGPAGPPLLLLLLLLDDELLPRAKHAHDPKPDPSGLQTWMPGDSPSGHAQLT